MEKINKVNQIYKELIENRKDPNKETRSLICYCLVLLFFFFSFSFFLKTNLLSVQVVGQSMEHTLHNGDFLYVKISDDVTYGDIIIIDNKKPNEYIVKRVIGMEGDTITIKDGCVYRNNEYTPLVEDYVKKVNGVALPTAVNPSNPNYTECRTWKIGKGEIFFLGDNRQNSNDSRYYGTCKVSDIVGYVPNWSYSIKGFTTAINTFLSNVRKFLNVTN